MDRLTIYACVYVDYSRLFLRVYVLLFSVDDICIHYKQNGSLKLSIEQRK